MKIFSKKQVEALFDDVMTLRMVADEVLKMQIMNVRPDAKEMMRLQRIIIERSTNSAFMLRGCFGLAVSKKIGARYNAEKLGQMLKTKEAEENGSKPGNDK